MKEDFKEFLRGLADQANEAIDESGIDDGSVRTADGIVFPPEAVACIKTLLSRASEDTLQKIEGSELFQRLAVNFVKSNTKKDLDIYIKHNTILLIAKIMGDK